MPPSDIQIFLGSALESQKVIDQLQTSLLTAWARHRPADSAVELNVRPWFECGPTAGDTVIEWLERNLRQYDFAIFELTGVDQVVSRDRRVAAPRDNVLLEIGAFFGKIGRDRTILLVPDCSDVHLPTNLAGIEFVKYRSAMVETDLPQALAVATNTIIKRVLELGPIKDRPEATSVVTELEVTIEKLRGKDEKTRGRLLKIIDDIINEEFWSDGSVPTPFMKSILDRISEADSGIDRIYALDHLEPDKWAYPRFYYYFFLQAREYLKRNHGSIPDDPERHAWRITVSPNVREAIDNALQNIGKVFAPDTSTGSSATAFDDRIAPYELHEGDPKLEIARILTWDPEVLRQGAAELLIRVHSAFNIPLFYLDPADLDRDRTYDYFLTCKKGQDNSTHLNLLDGLFWEKKNAHKELPLSYLPVHSLRHFSSLLAHPRLLFAVDARRLLQQGKYDEFRGLQV